MMISGMSVIFFHVIGWHQEIERIIWGRERINLGIMGNCQKMGEWTAYCLSPSAARRAQVDKQFSKVPLKFRIFIHLYFWTGVTGLILAVIFVPPSVWLDVII